MSQKRTISVVVPQGTPEVVNIATTTTNTSNNTNIRAGIRAAASFVPALPKAPIYTDKIAEK